MRGLARTLLQLSLMVAFIFGLSFGAAAEPGRGQGKGFNSAGPPAAAERGDAMEDAGQPPGRELERKNQPGQEGKEPRDGTPPEGLAKQREKKMEQERKEEGKGSEQGQKMREEHSRKWWKFWDW